MTTDDLSQAKAGDPGAADRGRRASHTANGDPVGSGSGAGGGGAPEDFDSESQLGDGLDPSSTAGGRPGKGGDAGDGG